MDARFVITAVAAAIAIGLAVLRQKLVRRSGAFESALVLVFVLTMIWLPRSWRDWLTIVAVLFIGLWSWPPTVAITTTAIVAALALKVPGGSSVMVLLITGLLALSIAVDYYRTVERIDRARKLTPGQRPSGDIRLTGRIRALGEVKMPLDQIGECAWYRLAMGSMIVQSEALLEIRTSAGSAIVDPKGVTFEIAGGGKSLTPEERTRVLGRAPTPEEAKEGARLDCIAPGSEVFVIGAPDWEPSTHAEVSYREAPLVPVFRAGAGRPVMLEDRDGAVVRADKLWALWSWLAWGSLSAAIATMQLALVL